MEIKYLAVIEGGYQYKLGTTDKIPTVEYIPLINYYNIGDGMLEIVGPDGYGVSKVNESDCKILKMRKGMFVDTL